MTYTRLEDALTSFEKAIENRWWDYWAYYRRSETLHQLGRYEEALASYNEALEIRPNDAAGWYNRAQLLDDLGSA